MSERVMIVGDGGREDAFARMALDSGYEVVVPETMADIGRYHATDTGDYGTNSEQAVRFAQEKDVDTVFIGPEAPLVAGMADDLRKSGLEVFGVSAEGAQFEASKIFTHNFNEKYRIPQPRGASFANYENALRYSRTHDPLEYVIKADGLAGGKGVILADTETEAQAAIHKMMHGELFDGAGERLLLQERIYGAEVSIFAMTDGSEVLILPATQDHKRLKDGDKGPNTGGMGAYTGVPETVLSSNQIRKIRGTIVERAFAGMQSEGIEYQGALFIGIILDENDLDPETGEPTPKVLEYNVRFGDPEAEVLFPSVDEEVDLMGNIMRIARGDKLIVPQGYRPENKLARVALSVCLAGEGYPDEKYEGSRQLYHVQRERENVIFNHGNTYIDQYGIVRSKGGGRMGYVTGVDNQGDIAKAREAAYGAIGPPTGIWSENMQYRTDIGWQAIEATKADS